MRFRVIAAVVVATLFAGGILLGINLQGTNDQATNQQGTNHQGTQPATAATSNTGRAASGPGPSASSSSSGPASGSAPVSTTLSPQKVAVFCAIVSGNLTGAITISSCSQLPATGGSGTFPGALLDRSGSGTVTWNGTGTTTFVYVSSHPGSQRRKCPDGDAETTVRGAVTANSPLGVGNAGVKGGVHAKLCVDPALDVSLLAGRTFQL